MGGGRVSLAAKALSYYPFNPTYQKLENKRKE